MPVTPEFLATLEPEFGPIEIVTARPAERVRQPGAVFLSRGRELVPVREVQVRIDSGKVLRIVSNDLDAPAQEIADLYKQRWQIELFFRWVK